MTVEPELSPAAPPPGTRNRWILLALAVLLVGGVATAVAVAGGGDKALPKISYSASQGQAGGGERSPAVPSAAADGAAADVGFAAGVHYRFTGKPDGLPAKAAAYELGKVSKADAQRLAAAFGVAGTLTEDEFGFSSPSATQAGLQTSLYVDKASGQFSFSQFQATCVFGGATPGASGSSGGGSAGSTGSAGATEPAGPAADQAATTVVPPDQPQPDPVDPGTPVDPACAKDLPVTSGPATTVCAPPPPCGAPGSCATTDECRNTTGATPAPPTTIVVEPAISQADAVAAARAVLAKVGGPVAASDLQADSAGTGWSVTGPIVVDGHRVSGSGFQAFVQAGTDGRSGPATITSANGVVGTAAKLGDYPLVGVAKAVERLNAGQAVLGFGYGGVATGGVATSGAAVDAAGADSGPNASSAASPPAAPPPVPTTAADIPVEPNGQTDLERCKLELESQAGKTPPTTRPECALLAPEPVPAPGPAPVQEVELTGVTVGLALIGNHLLPVYEFTLAGGGTVMSPAVSDDLITSALPTPAPGAKPEIVPQPAPAANG